MFMEERQREIAELIIANGKIKISDITDKYNVSDESARRDLRLLEQKGMCKRTHGGAIAMKQVIVHSSKNRNYEEMTIRNNYRQIVIEAVKKIKENDVVFMTGGSFGYIMTMYLPRDIYYTVVVNSVDIGRELRSFDNIDVYIAGGRMRQSGSIVDTMANDFVSKIHFDICFLTCSGVTSDFGVSHGSDENASFCRTIINNSRKCILLTPSTKIGVDSFVKVCDVSAFDTVITDWDCLEEHISSFEEKDVNVIIVEDKNE